MEKDGDEQERASSGGDIIASGTTSASGEASNTNQEGGERGRDTQPTETATDANRAQALATLKQQPVQVFSDIVIWCHPKNVANLVQAFQAQISNAAYPAFVMWSGISGGRHMGVVVIEWEGTVSGAFVHDLRRDFEIVDFVAYDWEQALKERESRDAEAREEPLFEQWRATLANLRLHLGSVTHLQYLPQEVSLNAFLQACEQAHALVPRLIARTDSDVQTRLQHLPEQLTSVEIAAVFLRHAGETSDHPCPLEEILRRQLDLREAGQKLLLHLTEVQEALGEMKE